MSQRGFPKAHRTVTNFLTSDIETQNAKNIPGAHKISLETVMIGYDSPPHPPSIELTRLEMVGMIL